MQSAGDILVIDDDPPTVDFIAEALTDEGYTVRTGLTAADARAAITKQRPDLVLLDLYLPDTTGDMLVQDLKDDGLAHVPIIMITADAQIAHNLSIDGLTYYLLKPFDLDELLECVAKYIRRDKGTAKQ
jgi:DNA-binding response OmpR family regulator